MSKVKLTVSIDENEYEKLRQFSQENEETIDETVEKLIDTL